MDHSSTKPAADPRKIAASLSIGQRLTIRGLSDQYCTLGCASTAAKRLEHRKAKRPALTISRAGTDGREFALNALGLAVKAVLP
ncbi:hypothetical protein SAQ01S_18100 [Sphingomonas aquatilis NBRC 16722]|uniref:Uncharacterized protein n=1 Tax=Sphingomonas aquatilis TaxID=93063 RepID=A0AAW3TRH9_9SPHN|nr:hypothetical protein [Sphingomonas aquatilis]MBB3875286.1 hypothetical protein [Sphingomonas aquatilis]GEM72044.1 hypothetical protein SAQ01S_18100 [Sphingomonas aquatilis NBRC 16722]